jgi:3-oxoacyl-[acyl-carrier-protein] synthase II
MALKAVFGEEGAKKLKVSSTKGMTGHTLGAAGGIEAVITAKMMQTGIVPPTVNYVTPDPECDLDYVPNTAQTCKDIKVAISENLGFGGHNAAIAFRKME